MVVTWQDIARENAKIVAEQAAEIANLKTLAQALLDAQTDRWAAQDEHHCFTANVLVEAAHDALAKALEGS